MRSVCEAARPDSFEIIEFETSLARMRPSAATPVAIPIWRKVELMPEAMPARAGSTTPTAVDASGTFTRPQPTPETIIPGSRWVQSLVGVIPVISTRPAPISTKPGAIRSFVGT